jgi:hypothetical protein
MLTGRCVHEGAEIPRGTKARVRHAASTPAEPVQSLRADISAGLAEIVNRALAFHKSDRWSDAQSMLAALRALQAEAVSPSGSVRASLPTSSNEAQYSSLSCQRTTAEPCCRSGQLTGVGCVARVG